MIDSAASHDCFALGYAATRDLYGGIVESRDPYVLLAMYRTRWTELGQGTQVQRACGHWTWATTWDLPCLRCLSSAMDSELHEQLELQFAAEEAQSHD